MSMRDPADIALDTAMSNEPTAGAPVTESHSAAEVFASLPYGIVVTGPSGEVEFFNPAAAGMLAHLSDRNGSDAATCCDLLGCRRDDGPLAGVCLTELALAGAAALPEVRVDLDGLGASAAWVTGTRMGQRVILHLRPGDRNDRRRRSEPYWIGGPVLRVAVLGNTTVESPEGRIDGRWLGHRPGHLFKLLIAERRRVIHTEEIAQTLWPSAGPTALTSVRHFVHVLRDHLEPAREKRTPSSFVIAQSGGYQLDARRVWVDADEFEAHLAAGFNAFANGEPKAAAERIERGLDLYRGDFLADEPYAEWALDERNRLRGLAGRALRLLADQALSDYDLDTAATHLQRLAEVDPFDIDVQRTLIALCLRRGRRSEALRRFNALRQRLLSAFGELPDFELADLAQLPLTPSQGSGNAPVPVERALR